MSDVGDKKDFVVHCKCGEHFWVSGFDLVVSAFEDDEFIMKGGRPTAACRVGDRLAVMDGNEGGEKEEKKEKVNQDLAKENNEEEIEKVVEKEGEKEVEKEGDDSDCRILSLNEVDPDWVFCSTYDDFYYSPSKQFPTRKLWDSTSTTESDLHWRWRGRTDSNLINITSDDEDEVSARPKKVKREPVYNW